MKVGVFVRSSAELSTQASAARVHTGPTARRRPNRPCPRGDCSRARQDLPAPPHLPGIADGGRSVLPAAGSDYHRQSAAGGGAGTSVCGSDQSDGVMQQDLMPGRSGLASAARRRSGQIKIHGPDAFEGMRRAGRLAAETLDFITPYVAPGRHHRRARPAVPRLHRRPRRDPGAAQLSRLSEIDLHLDQPCRLPRHPGRPAADGRRHPQYRRDRDPRRLARRHEPHVLCRRAHPGQGAQAGRRDLRGDDARHRGGEAGRAHRRDRRRDPALCREPPLFGGARFLRPRRRPRVPRRAVDPALRPARTTGRCCARACSSPSSR